VVTGVEAHRSRSKRWDRGAAGDEGDARAFQLTSATKVERVERTPQGSEGWSWSYVSRPLSFPSFAQATTHGDVDLRSGRNAAIEVQAVRPGRTP